MIRKAEVARYTLEVYPDRPQVATRDYATALRLARGFGGTTHVRLWFADDAGTFIEVEPPADS